MSSSFDLPELDHFTAGTEGEPGARIFYLQARAAGQVVTLRLEKGQVAALAEYLADLLTDLPAPPDEEVPAESDLIEPVVPEWVVGQIGVAFDESSDRMLVRIDELADEDPDPETGWARFSLTRPQVAAFVGRAAHLVTSGRPPCPLCGRPLDPTGHMCIKTNGHRVRS